MRIIRPITITYAMISSSTVPEADYPVWNSTKGYGNGDNVIKTTGVHKIYECITTTQKYLFNNSGLNIYFDSSGKVQFPNHGLSIGAKLQLTYADPYYTTLPLAIYMVRSASFDANSFYLSPDSTDSDSIGPLGNSSYKIQFVVTTNINKDPETSPADWVEVSATNRWLSFDQTVTKQTTQATSAQYVLTPGKIDSIAFLNVECVNINVLVHDAVDGDVYNQNFSMYQTSVVFDWYSYFFEDSIYKTDLSVFNIPPYINPTITLTLTGPTVKVGEIVLGLQRKLGYTNFNPSISIIDYSKKEADVFGNYSIVKRTFSKRMTCDMWLDPTQVDELDRILSFYRSEAVVWVGSDDSITGVNIFNSMIIYGFYKTFNIVIPDVAMSGCTFEIEGLT